MALLPCDYRFSIMRRESGDIIEMRVKATSYKKAQALVEIFISIKPEHWTRTGVWTAFGRIG